jgi:hypothetical protein
MPATNTATVQTAIRQHLSTPIVNDGFAENARVKALLYLDAEEARAALHAAPVVQPVDPRLAPLAARIDALTYRQRGGHSAARATTIADLTREYDSIRAAE